MRLLSPAKINLFLYVTGKRPDGYHLLWSLMCPVGLCDEIDLSFGKAEITCRCDAPGVPSGPENLAHRAAVLFLETLEKAGKAPGGAVEITIRKQIPAGAGLGGGSSNAATVLSGLNRHFKEPFSLETLIDMGTSLGADVPFFIYGVPALVGGIGEILEPAPAIRPFTVVLVYPGVAVSTAGVFKNLNFGLTNNEKVNKKLLFNGSVLDPAVYLHNDLEAVAESFCPEIPAVREALSAAGADGALTSGSGSSVFGIFFDADQAARAAVTLGRQHPNWQVFSVGAKV
jgi:4-diphosphocytidyl-2-C-methyl-D-erythritol kinase